MSVLLYMPDEWQPERWRERLAAHLPDHRIVTQHHAYDPAEIRYACVWKPPTGMLAGFSNLAILFSLGAGVDHVLADPELPDLPLVRIVDPDLTARMSEYVVQHVLNHHRRQPLYAEQQRRRHWRERSQPAARDVRAGIMGLGELGRDAAVKLKMIGFDVAGWSRTAKAADDIAVFAGRDGLDEFLARTEILVVLLPLTEATTGIIDYGLLSKLAHDRVADGPVLINAGRGGLQVEADILKALNDGTLGAATLDVFNEEPLPEASPFWDHAKVTITPHNAAVSNPKALAARIAAGIAAFEAGRPLDHVVDRKRGY